jgi:transcription termination factor Rho
VYNSFGSGGYTMSGDVDFRTLEKPRQLFSLARDFNGRGSLIIRASAFIEMGI